MRNKFSLYRSNKAAPGEEGRTAQSSQNTVPRRDLAGDRSHASSTAPLLEENVGSQWWQGNLDSAFTDLELKREQVKQANRVDSLSRQRVSTSSTPAEPGSPQSPSFLERLPWDSSSALTLFGGDQPRFAIEEPEEPAYELPRAVDTRTKGGGGEGGLLHLFGGTMSDLAESGSALPQMDMSLFAALFTVIVCLGWQSAKCLKACSRSQ